MQKRGGFLVISLDFELFWGMFDKVTIDSYGENMLGVQKVVPELLNYFTEHNIHATWATVGMLMCEGKEDLLNLVPRETLRPRYNDMKISSYRHIESSHVGANEKKDPYHFAPSLVREIINTPGQELGSHTFSHFYCLDGIENRVSVFETDLELEKTICKRFGVTPTSLVFPRNQTTDSACNTAFENGITAYRGTENHFLYRPRRDGKQNKFIRALRLMDSYINISGHHTTSLESVAKNHFHNIPASKFLRPYSKKLRFFENMRIRRIKNSMTKAALNNEIFHLWWHPHNFGIHRKKNMDNLHEIISHFRYLQETYGMQSRNMKEISNASDVAT